MDKYDIAYVYINSKDGGMELKHSLRSLENITNFSGNVWLFGDKEAWFKQINHVAVRRIFGKPYLDQVMKMKRACEIMPSQFIAMQDDIFITEAVEPTVYYLGELKDDMTGFHKRSKKLTKDTLLEMNLPILDYEAHAPMLVDRDKLLDTLNLIIRSRLNLQWRSMYGNMHNVKAELFEDKKTKTRQLKQGTIISTNYYTDELDKLFTEKSQYEV